MELYFVLAILAVWFVVGFIVFVIGINFIDEFADFARKDPVVINLLLMFVWPALVVVFFIFCTGDNSNKLVDKLDFRKKGE